MRIKRVFIVIAFALCMTTFCGCDESIAMIYSEMGTPPDRIVYMANVDTELDLSGGTFITSNKMGYRDEHSLADFPSSLPFNNERIEHSIDFTTPGVYKVDLIRRDKVFFSYLVQVVDDEILTHIKEGTYDEIASKELFNPYL